MRNKRNLWVIAAASGLAGTFGMLGLLKKPEEKVHCDYRFEAFAHRIVDEYYSPFFEAPLTEENYRNIGKLCDTDGDKRVATLEAIKGYKKLENEFAAFLISASGR